MLTFLKTPQHKGQLSKHQQIQSFLALESGSCQTIEALEYWKTFSVFSCLPIVRYSCTRKKWFRHCLRRGFRQSPNLKHSSIPGWLGRRILGALSDNQLLQDILMQEFLKLTFSWNGFGGCLTHHSEYGCV